MQGSPAVPALLAVSALAPWAMSSCRGARAGCAKIMSSHRRGHGRQARRRPVQEQGWLWCL